MCSQYTPAGCEHAGFLCSQTSLRLYDTHYSLLCQRMLRITGNITCTRLVTKPPPPCSEYAGSAPLKRAWLSVFPEHASHQIAMAVTSLPVWSSIIRSQSFSMSPTVGIDFSLSGYDTLPGLTCTAFPSLSSTGMCV